MEQQDFESELENRLKNTDESKIVFTYEPTFGSVFAGVIKDIKMRKMYFLHLTLLTEEKNAQTELKITNYSYGQTAKKEELFDKIAHLEVLIEMTDEKFYGYLSKTFSKFNVERMDVFKDWKVYELIEYVDDSSSDTNDDEDADEETDDGDTVAISNKFKQKTEWGNKEETVKKPLKSSCEIFVTNRKGEIIKRKPNMRYKKASKWLGSTIIRLASARLFGKFDCN